MANSQIENAFRYHRPPVEAQDVMKEIRAGFLNLARLIDEKAPNGREKSSAFTRLEEAQFHVNAAITRQYPITDD